MGLTNDSLIDTVFEKFPEKKDVTEQGDEIFVNWNFQDFQDGGYLNFKADRSDLFCTKHHDRKLCIKTHITPTSII